MDQVQRLVALIDQAYDRRSWHGTNLRGSIRGLSAERAAWRPGRTRHNVWEIVVHAAYWKYAVTRRFVAMRRGSFPLKGSNWFERPDRASRGETGWRADVALLESAHRTLREAVASLTTDQLDRRPRGSTVSHFDIIAGIAAHDLYHAGQIQLIKRLQAR
jgi:hypothetical protein